MKYRQMHTIQDLIYNWGIIIDARNAQKEMSTDWAITAVNMGSYFTDDLKKSELISDIQGEFGILEAEHYSHKNTTSDNAKIDLQWRNLANKVDRAKKTYGI